MAENPLHCSRSPKCLLAPEKCRSRVTAMNSTNRNNQLFRVGCLGAFSLLTVGAGFLAARFPGWFTYLLFVWSLTFPVASLYAVLIGGIAGLWRRKPDIGEMAAFSFAGVVAGLAPTVGSVVLLSQTSAGGTPSARAERVDGPDQPLAKFRACHSKPRIGRANRFSCSTFPRFAQQSAFPRARGTRARQDQGRRSGSP